MKKVVAMMIFLIGSSVTVAQTGLPTYKEPKQDAEDPEVFNITKNLEPLKFCQLQYISYEEQVADIKKEAQLKMWTDDQTKERIDAMKYHGKLFFTVKRATREAVDPKHFTIVVKNMKDEELFREKPQGGPARLERSTVLMYRNYGAIGIPEGFKEQVKVFIIDEIGEVRHEYLVRPGATKI